MTCDLFRAPTMANVSWGDFGPSDARRQMSDPDIRQIHVLTPGASKFPGAGAV